MKDIIINDILSTEKETFTKDEVIKLIEKHFVTKQENELIEGDMVIKFDEWVVIKDGQKTHLPKKEFLMLVYFINNKNRIIGRQELLNRVWEYGVVVGDRTIDVHIRKIRRKFPTLPIVTKKCNGYMWRD